jgi:hypothetical protein
VETAGIAAFGVYWFAKGREIAHTDAECRVLQRDVVTDTSGKLRPLAAA